MKSLKEQIIERFTQDKSKFYELTDNELEMVDIMEDVIKGLQQDYKYMSDQYKRELNDKLNFQEIIAEQEEQIKELKEKLESIQR